MPTALDPSSSPIFLAGHTGLAGSAMLHELHAQGYRNILTRTRAELDLCNPSAVEQFFAHHRPAAVILTAAKAGGILANTQYPGDFLTENLQIQTNVLTSAMRSGVDRLIFLASSAAYPRLAPQPIREESLHTGPLEPTVRPYALAKLAGIEMCWALNRQHGTRFLALMPPNLYGPGSRFLANGGVLGSLLLKAYHAHLAGDSSFGVWGTGDARREFLHTADLARACLHLLTLDDTALAPLFNSEEPPLLNAGSGVDHSIREIAQLCADTVGFNGALRFDSTKPDGTPRKLLDPSRLNALGWQSSLSLADGLRQTYAQLRPLL